MVWGIPRQFSRLKIFRSMPDPGGVFRKRIIIQVRKLPLGLTAIDQSCLRRKGDVTGVFTMHPYRGIVHIYIYGQTVYLRCQTNRILSLANLIVQKTPPGTHLPVPITTTGYVAIFIVGLVLFIFPLSPLRTDNMVFLIMVLRYFSLMPE